MIKGMGQSILVFLIAILVPSGLRLSSAFNALDFIGIFFTLFLLGLGFSSLFTAVAVRIAKWETLIGVVNLLNLPLLFASSALLPISSMPDWLQPVARVNPISVGADVSRTLMVHGSLNPSQTTTVLFGSAYLLGFAALTTIVGVITARLALKAE